MLRCSSVASLVQQLVCAYIKMSVSPVMVSASRVLTGLDSLLLDDLNAWRVALAVGETFKEAADGRMGPSGRFGPTSSTVASLDAVATSDIASLSCKHTSLTFSTFGLELPREITFTLIFHLIFKN